MNSGEDGHDNPEDPEDEDTDGPDNDEEEKEDAVAGDEVDGENKGEGKWTLPLQKQNKFQYMNDDFQDSPNRKTFIPS